MRTRPHARTRTRSPFRSLSSVLVQSRWPGNFSVETPSTTFGVASVDVASDVDGGGPEISWAEAVREATVPFAAARSAAREREIRTEIRDIAARGFLPECERNCKSAHGAPGLGRYAMRTGMIASV